MSYVTPSCSVFVRNFSAGYRDTPEPDVLDAGASPDARNAMFARIGADPLRVTMGKRLGYRLITESAPMGAGVPVDGLFEFRHSGGAPVLVMVSGGWLLHYKSSAFEAVAGAQGFTAGHQARGINVKNQAVVTDGTFMVRLRSTGVLDLAAYPVGFAAPTTAPGLATAAGPGVTGTYEGFAVWYDQASDHESSPGPTSVAVVFANQARQWARPGGTPPSSVTHWRVYARRVDISEVNYYRTGTFVIAAPTGTEATSDLARVNIGPPPHANDPPPGAFEVLSMFRGYAIGVLPKGTDLYFSSPSDFESWNPSDVLKVNFGRQEVRSVKVVGENCVVQTPTMSFRLEGDRMPFRIVNLHTAFGNVSQDASTEVEGYLYGWDELKGPYRVSRDFGTWESLATNRIERQTRHVNHEALQSIICVHDPARHLVLWAFPSGSETRKRVVVGYDYTLETWTAPITGLEYGAWTTHTMPGTTDVGVYVGDLWGRVFEMFSGTRDGVPVGPSTVTATVTAAGPSYVEAAGAAFYTGGHGLMGLPVAVVSPAGLWQWRRIRSNSAISLTLDVTTGNPWTNVPQPGWTVIVGGIEWYWTTPWLDFGRPDRYKRGSYLTMMAATASAAVRVEVSGKFNNEAGVSVANDYSFAISGTAGIWGQSLWGQSLWAATPQRTRKLRLGRTFLTTQLRFQNFHPDQTVDVLAYGVEGDWLPRRRTR